jgi:hypothetical protein
MDEFEVIEPLPSKKDPNAPRTIRDMLEADSERMAPLVLSTLLAGGEPAKQLVGRRRLRTALALIPLVSGIYMEPIS